MKRLRLAYLSGPVDGVQVYKTWSAGQQHDYFGTSFLSEFYQACSDLEAKSFVITTLRTGHFQHTVGTSVIENRPLPAGKRGIFFHIAIAFWFLCRLPGLIKFRPNVLVVTALPNYWFLLSPLRLFGIRILPAIHGTLWPKFGTLRRSWRTLIKLNVPFYNHTDYVMAASHDTARQARMMSGRPKIYVFLPTYRPSQFAAIVSANIDKQPFRIIFAGRIEVSKGVYDLVKIAESLVKRNAPPFHIDICGAGTEIEGLIAKISETGLNRAMTCHGFCGHQRLSELLAQSHVVIVPSTTELEEGFAMICAEAILAERPLVTSAVCPALEYVRAATVEAIPDDVESYAQALFDLSTDRALYKAKQVACKKLQRQFYDESFGYAATLSGILREWTSSTPYESDLQLR